MISSETEAVVTLIDDCLIEPTPQLGILISLLRWIVRAQFTPTILVAVLITVQAAIALRVQVRSNRYVDARMIAHHRNLSAVFVQFELLRGLLIAPKAKAQLPMDFWCPGEDSNFHSHTGTGT